MLFAQHWHCTPSVEESTGRQSAVRQRCWWLSCTDTRISTPRVSKDPEEGLLPRGCSCSAGCCREEHKVESWGAAFVGA